MRVAGRRETQKRRGGHILFLPLLVLALLMSAGPCAAAPATAVSWGANNYMETYEDRSYSARPRIWPDGADYDRVEYHSDNTHVATVESSNNGLTAVIRARNDGWAWITVTVYNRDGTSVSDALRLRVYDYWGWNGIGISFGGGGCNTAVPGSFAALLALAAFFYSGGKNKKRRS